MKKKAVGNRNWYTWLFNKNPQTLRWVIICKANEKKLSFANCDTLNQHYYYLKKKIIITKRLQTMGFVWMGETSKFNLLNWCSFFLKRQSPFNDSRKMSFRFVLLIVYSSFCTLNIHLVKIIILHWSVHNLKF